MLALRFNGEAIVKRERESPPSGDDLELGLGINGGRGTLIKEEQGQIVFTRAQIQEFLLQAAIFRYLRSGLRVPISLVFPVWSSVACSSKAGSVQKHFPSLAILFHRLEFLGMMDPEPGRCRRTDGKKWRCSGSVVPDSKYCEKHIHRGANRSRKHVEASQNASCFPSEKGDLGGSSSHNGNGDWKSKGKSIVGDRTGARKRGSVGILADKCNPKKNKLSIHQSLSNFNPTSTSDANVSNPGSFNGSSDASFSPGFGFVPNNIPQHCNATVSSRLELKTEPYRCNKTDGKKWRCQRNVAPGKTTCEVHLIRQRKAKSRMEQRAMFESNKINLNTDLSIKGGNSSSSDATTMTDDSAATIST